MIQFDGDESFEVLMPLPLSGSSRLRRGALASLALLGVTAALLSVPTSANAAGGSALTTETFANQDVPDARWVGLGDACLTAAPAGARARAGASNLGGCSKTQDSVTNLGSGSDGYLQLTDNSGASTAAAVLNRAFPSSAGLQMTFDEYQYATSDTGLGPADGIGFFLTDGAYTLTRPGPQGAGYGGALGYASIEDQAGIPHGYLGLGLDVYGNYEDQPYVGTSCAEPHPQAPNSITLRGPGDGTDGYCIAGTTGYAGLRNAPATAPGGAQGAPQRVMVTISPTTAADPFPTVTVTVNGAQVLQEKMTTPVPATLKLGFAASTGGGHEVHMIRNVSVSTVDGLGGITLAKTVDHTVGTGTDKTIFTQGDTVPYTFLVTNTGGEALSDIHLTDPKIADITCPATTLQPADSFTCTGLYGPLTAAEAAAGRFDNTATVTGIDTDGGTQTSTSSATIPTFESAPLSITKHVTGTGASAVPSGTSYTVQYSYPSGSYEPVSTAPDGSTNTYPAGSGTLTVTNDGTTSTSSRIPTGAVVTLTEDAASPVDGTQWGTPTFSENPVTIGSDSATAVTLDNPIAADRGSVAWSKVASVGGELLSGSQWLLTGPDGYAKTVTDNGANDADGTAGRLAVNDLAWGGYTLTETKAPAGYVLDKSAHTFTISASDLAAALGAIANTPAPIPPTPKPSAAGYPVPGAAVNTGGTMGSGNLLPLWVGLLLLGLTVLGAVTVIAVRHRVLGDRR
ncbi:DUF11 domain-containing protein [Leifsonia sp. ZF2019]|uniref:DUF7507 domain-containing protein n=1 Tax=Leifsonia sp. ZF2019 TaxID=2781978 RepID=UPI001CC0A8E3|nr:DUF5979 domain-containing protein [Leifsonia sp. ZF2019]UAJ79328.1 DUF11 domain-containing protein [Leifsonia sp. ZF2019]